ncbi:TylF/MycF/NovP-related O-methyltransferase [Actinomadura parmotrematis]|uniref:TylF/MycF family methyltransferase n=1 Tax=Actinomadura parmotrematis TaxID=2864039 RepID=A0ABS7G540_9ACTN|nr:TylF/MycF/NovP-related O-methyltransferase [Actinomadura parmotrematis]MBW8486984.1 TylF/MycF family methyltransferase [Actinomadura parmotrematis]
MTWRKNINGGLRQLTGYELRKPVPSPRCGAAPKRTARPAAKAAAKAAPKPAAPSFPADYDDLAKATITAVRPWTMTSPEKLNALIHAVRHVVAHDVPGDIVECGVWRGGSMQAAARTLREAGDESRDLYLFDTYEGMPPPSGRDLRHDGASAADLLERDDRGSGVRAVASLEDVREGFAQVDFPAERVHYVKGLVQDTVPERAPERISVLRLDTDWYASTRHELAHLYPRLSPGGVLILDDYGWWQGSREAVEEYLAETGARLLLLRVDEGRIAVKP